MSTKKILKDANCEMTVVCGKQWDALDQTEEDGIRFCGDCKKLVFYTQTSAELRIAAQRWLCVYIDPTSSLAKENNRNLSDGLHVRNRIRQIETKSIKDLRGPTVGAVIFRDLPEDK